MWAIYLVLVVLAIVRAAKLQYCQELMLKAPEGSLRKDVATIVFAMDTSCVMCYQEVQRLAILKSQMASLGHNVDILVALDHLPSNHHHELPSEVAVDLEDAWVKLGQLNGHIFVFDKCGRLAYQVITPWSRQMYPFTAMAGLSALYDAPCGECNTTSEVLSELPERRSSDENTHNGSQGVLVKVDEQQQGSKLPLTITIREKHAHVENGKWVTYDAMELRADDPNYHGHGTATYVDQDTTMPTAGLSDASDADGTVSTTSEPNRENDSRKGSTESTRDTSEGSRVNREVYEDLLKRYQPLMKWRSCANLVMSVQTRR